MAVDPKDKQPAFANLHEHDGNISLWVNRTLLPGLSTTLQKHQHHSLQDFAIACTQIYRGEKKKYKNDHCSIQISEAGVIHDDKDPKDISGASMTFHKEVIDAASKSFMGSENRAIGKIGIKFRDMLRKQVSFAKG